MGNFVKHAVAVGATALIISATTAPSVHAGGLIADLLKPVIGEKAARELDHAPLVAHRDQRAGNTGIGWRHGLSP